MSAWSLPCADGGVGFSDDRRSGGGRAEAWTPPPAAASRRHHAGILLAGSPPKTGLPGGCRDPPFDRLGVLPPSSPRPQPHVSSLCSHLHPVVSINFHNNPEVCVVSPCPSDVQAVAGGDSGPDLGPVPACVAHRLSRGGRVSSGWGASLPAPQGTVGWNLGNQLPKCPLWA